MDIPLSLTSPERLFFAFQIRSVLNAFQMHLDPIAPCCPDLCSTSASGPERDLWSRTAPYATMSFTVKDWSEDSDVRVRA